MACSLVHKRLLALLMLGFTALPLPYSAEARTVRERQILSGSGAFLAALVAGNRYESKPAATYFSETLQSDPRNPDLLDKAFVANLSDGNVDEAFKLAERAVSLHPDHPLAQAALGVRALKAKQFVTARNHFSKVGPRNSDLTLSLLTAFGHVGSGNLKQALAITDKFNLPQLAGYKNFFSGLMADIAGDKHEAGKRLEAAYALEPGTFRVADAYGRWLSRQGRNPEAIKLYEKLEATNPSQPFTKRPLEELRANKTLAPLTPTVSEGASEVLYGLGAAGATARDPSLAIIYLQLARYLDPKEELTRVTLAEIYEQLKQFEQAETLFGSVAPNSPYRMRSLIGRATALERLEKTDQSIESLQTLLKESPGEIEASETLAGLYRARKNWDESIKVYTAAIERIKTPEKQHWTLFFGRAIAYERAKQWPKAEIDFQKALSILPEPPKSRREKMERAQVMNYLAYSWVDQHMNIDQSFEMLKKAVEYSPEDGAIVDSLGWAYYRLGKYDDAVRELEKAITLRAGDSTINDHLGDAYWKVGRKLEAGFKWNHARDSKPEPDELEQILKKIEKGLPDSDKAQASIPAAQPSAPAEKK